MGNGEPAIASHTTCTFEFRLYQRRFNSPLKTSYGEWRDRPGIILKLTATNGRTSYGEIAPLPWFGSETVEDALAFCQQLPSAIDQPDVLAIPATLPACQFGFESAWTGLQQPAAISTPTCQSLPMSALLPAGEVALSVWKTLWQVGFRTFKWKIGVADLDQELRWFRKLKAQLPAEARLRLDANGGLTWTQAEKWLELCDRFPIEYLEQPLPPTQFREMRALQANHATAIALDESVATLEQLWACMERGWRGVMVIKPAIVGSPAKLRQLCQTYTIDAVFSSVFETVIGRQAGLQLAAELGNGDRATGYGTSHWFNDTLEVTDQSYDDLWQRL